MYEPFGSLAGQAPPAQPVAPLAINAYTGSYANDYYGRALVEADGSKLFLKLGPGGAKTYALRHWSGDTFVFDLQGENAPPGSLSRIDFSLGASGLAQSLRIEYYAEDLARGVFTKTAAVAPSLQTLDQAIVRHGRLAPYGAR